MSGRLTITVWRHIPVPAHPLHFGRILKPRGRWNRPGIYVAVYTALTKDGARAELRNYREQNLYASGRMEFSRGELCSIEVTMHRVLDFTDPSTIKALGIDVHDLLGDDDAQFRLNAQIAWDLRQQMHSPEANRIRKIRRVSSA